MRRIRCRLLLFAKTAAIKQWRPSCKNAQLQNPHNLTFFRPYARSSASKWTLNCQHGAFDSQIVTEYHHSKRHLELPVKRRAATEIDRVGCHHTTSRITNQWRSGLRFQVPPQKLCTCHFLVRCSKRAANSRNTEFVVSSVFSPMSFCDTLRDKCANALHNTRKAMAAASQFFYYAMLGPKDQAWSLGA